MLRIRVDDYPFTKHEEKDKHNPGSFLAFHRVLSHYYPQYLLGVIPGNTDGWGWAVVRDILIPDGVVIGMHGISHNEEALDKYQNEFPPFFDRNTVENHLRVTAESIRNGLSIPLNIYMPPRNRIDLRTLSVLPRAGFNAFTGGPETDIDLRHNHEFEEGSVEYIHSQPPHEYGRTDELIQRRSIEVLQQLCEDGKTVNLTLHWTWETNIGLQYLSKFLNYLEGYFCGWTV